jgi:hypothetical protein
MEIIGEKSYHLDFPPQLGIHDVLNMNNIKLFDPPLLEEPTTIQHLVDNIVDLQPPLLTYTIPYSITCTTH